MVGNRKYQLLTDRERRRICVLYCEYKLSINTIAERFEMAAATISRILREAGVAVKSTNRTAQRT